MRPIAWVWIHKPTVTVIPIARPALPNRWQQVFVTKASYLPCLGRTKTSGVCRHPVQRWSPWFRGSALGAFSGYCATHRPEGDLPWVNWGAMQTIVCPCGCGASAQAQGQGLIAAAHRSAADWVWDQVLRHLGPDQWLVPQGAWTVMMNTAESIAWTSGIVNDQDVEAYRTWLFEGPAAPWNDAS